MTPHELKTQIQELSAAIGRAKADGQDAAALIARHQALHQQSSHDHRKPGKSAPGPPTLRVLDSLADLPPQQYDELLQASNTVSPFMTLDWLQPWQESFASDYDLHLIIVEQGEQLVAALPLIIGTEKRHLWRRPVARFLGTGPGLRGNYFALALSSKAADGTAELLNDHLEGLLENRVLLLENLSPFDDGAATLAMLYRQPRREISLAAQGGCIHGPLPSTFEEFINSVPRATRRNTLRRGDEALRQEGRLDYRVCERPDDIPEFLETLARFNVQRRDREGQESTWADERNMRCREEACARFLDHNRLRLELLVHNGKPIAALVGYVCNRSYFCYNMGFEQEYSQSQPGHLLLARRIEQSINEGLTGFNFLVGEADYKRQYFRQALPELTATVLPSHGPQHCFEGACQFLRGLRKL